MLHTPACSHAQRRWHMSVADMQRKQQYAQVMLLDRGQSCCRGRQRLLQQAASRWGRARLSCTHGA